jgi:hypothetical protein
VVAEQRRHPTYNSEPPSISRRLSTQRQLVGRGTEQADQLQERPFQLTSTPRPTDKNAPQLLYSQLEHARAVEPPRSKHLLPRHRLSVGEGDLAPVWQLRLSASVCVCACVRTCPKYKRAREGNAGANNAAPICQPLRHVDSALLPTSHHHDHVLAGWALGRDVSVCNSRAQNGGATAPVPARLTDQGSP